MRLADVCDNRSTIDDIAKAVNTKGWGMWDAGKRGIVFLCLLGDSKYVQKRWGLILWGVGTGDVGEQSTAHGCLRHGVGESVQRYL